MINNKKLLDKVISVQAWAAGLYKEATDLRKELEGVSTPTTSKKKGLSVEELSKIEMKRQKRFLKKSREV